MRRKNNKNIKGCGRKIASPSNAMLAICPADHPSLIEPYNSGLVFF
jgi:hypothetical protein